MGVCLHWPTYYGKTWNILIHLWLHIIWYMWSVRGPEGLHCILFYYRPVCYFEPYLQLRIINENMLCHMAGLLVNIEMTATLCLFPGINTIRISSINMDFISQAFETHSEVPECQKPLTASVMCCQILKWMNTSELHWLCLAMGENEFEREIWKRLQFFCCLVKYE